jgi:hypothetical protein
VFPVAKAMRGWSPPSQATMQQCGAAPRVRASSPAICARFLRRALLEAAGETHHGAALDGGGSQPLVPVRIVSCRPEIGRKSKGSHPGAQTDAREKNLCVAAARQPGHRASKSA